MSPMKISHWAVGNWPAPFGIVLVLDRLSALMVLVASVVALAALAYAVMGWDRRGAHFHALFQFQLLGINGAGYSFADGAKFRLGYLTGSMVLRKQLCSASALVLG